VGSNAGRRMLGGGVEYADLHHDFTRHFAEVPHLDGKTRYLPGPEPYVENSGQVPNGSRICQMRRSRTTSAERRTLTKRRDRGKSRCAESAGRSSRTCSDAQRSGRPQHKRHARRPNPPLIKYDGVAREQLSTACSAQSSETLW
jgi:hypothetical protein